MKVRLTRFTTDPVMAIEEAASKCYDSQPSPEGRITNNCLRSGHTSVVEHVSFTWEIEGVSRALLAQLTRHRVASFSVQSQRYVKYNGGFNYVTPPSIIALGAEAVESYKQDMEYLNQAYNRWLSMGIDAEDARMVLPNACCTTLTVTMNLREFMHFCNERLCARAQWEIRSLCKEMVKCVNEATDGAFAYYLVPKCEKHKGFPFCTESKEKSCDKHPTLKEVYGRPRSEIKTNKQEEI